MLQDEAGAGDAGRIGASAADSVSLVYQLDSEPGIRRLRRGKRFDYVRHDGSQVRDRTTLERIRALMIPPAWSDVWISAKADGHLQATGRDVRGRKQYRYHERWTACRDEAKYSSLTDFARALPSLRKRVEADLRKRGLSRERVLATIVWLLDNTMTRVGNKEYARDNKSFGLTTLRDRHVKVEGPKLRIAFKGKSGREWQLKITDRRVARIVKGVQDIPGQHLFQYVDEAGDRRAIQSQDVNNYIREVGGVAFTSKHFRTWGGTVLAATLLAEREAPESSSAAAKALNAVIDNVAARLNNTRAVCRKCYVHPAVGEAFANGALAEEIAVVRRRNRRAIGGLSREETIVLHWLEAAQAKRARPASASAR